MEGFAGYQGEVLVDVPSPKLGRKGDKIEIDAAGTGASGEGLVQCAVQLEQDKAYWEIKVVKKGALWFGVATGASPLQELPGAGEERSEMDMNKLWGYHSEDPLFKGEIGEGTVIGVSYNQASGPPAVNFFLDGVLVEGGEIDGIRGVAIPTAGTTGATVLKCNFSHVFECPPSGRYEKYDGVMLAGKMI